jgi:hypothetical protein
MQVLLINIILLRFIQKVLANMNLEKTQAIETATGNLNSELAVAQRTIGTLQMAIW